MNNVDNFPTQTDSNIIALWASNSFAGFSYQTASNFYTPEKSISENWPYFITAVLDNFKQNGPG